MPYALSYAKGNSYMMHKKYLGIIICLSIISMMYAPRFISRWFTRAKSCIGIVEKGADYAYKRLSYTTKKKFLKIADTLQVLDPRITALHIEEKSKRSSLAAAQIALSIAERTLDAAEGVAEPLSVLSATASHAVGTVFNVTKASFVADAADLKNPKVQFALDAVIAGHTIQIDSYLIDLQEVAQVARGLVGDTVIKLLVKQMINTLFEKITK